MTPAAGFRAHYVLSFTCAISVAEAGRDDVRAMLIGALGCCVPTGLAMVAIGAALVALTIALGG